MIQVKIKSNLGPIEALSHVRKLKEYKMLNAHDIIVMWVYYYLQYFCSPDHSKLQPCVVTDCPLITQSPKPCILPTLSFCFPQAFEVISLCSQYCIHTW